jgi:hypothetical protein
MYVFRIRGSKLHSERAIWCNCTVITIQNTEQLSSKRNIYQDTRIITSKLPQTIRKECIFEFLCVHEQYFVTIRHWTSLGNLLSNAVSLRIPDRIPLRLAVSRRVPLLVCSAARSLSDWGSAVVRVVSCILQMLR